VFQSYALFPNLTIDDNVAYGLVNRAQGARDRSARRELLTLVGLPSRAEVSGPALGRPAAAHRAGARARHVAGLLLLDEPLSALDALERVRLRGEIRALQQRLGVTTIMVTHDQEEALSMADRVVVMNAAHRAGRHAARDLRAPATPFVADFVGKINVLPAVAEGGGRSASARVAAVRCREVAAGHAGQAVLRPEEIVVQRERRIAATRCARRSRRSSSSARSAWSASRSTRRAGARRERAAPAVDAGSSRRAAPSREPAAACMRVLG
jgi:iron(III) transport system ATP-binding protein